MIVLCIDPNGNIAWGSKVDGAPAGSTLIEGTEAQWNNQDGLAYDGGQWRERLTVSPASAAVAPEAVVSITATLPDDGVAETNITFQVEGEAPIIEPVAALQAGHTFAFALAGTYRVTVSSSHHGSRTSVVTVE